MSWSRQREIRIRDESTWIDIAFLLVSSWLPAHISNHHINIKTPLKTINFTPNYQKRQFFKTVLQGETDEKSKSRRFYTSSNRSHRSINRSTKIRCIFNRTERTTHTKKKKFDIRVIVRVYGENVRTLSAGFRLLEILLASHLGLLSVASAHGCCRCWFRNPRFDLWNWKTLIWAACPLLPVYGFGLGGGELGDAVYK